MFADVANVFFSEMLFPNLITAESKLHAISFHLSTGFLVIIAQGR